MQESLVSYVLTLGIFPQFSTVQSRCEVLCEPRVESVHFHMQFSVVDYASGSIDAGISICGTFELKHVNSSLCRIAYKASKFGSPIPHLSFGGYKFNTRESLKAE